MKTLLAKVLDAQEEQAEQLRNLKKHTEAMEHDHMAVVESIEFKLSSLDQQADCINKKLTVLIKLLRNVIGTDGIPAETQRGKPLAPNRATLPSQDLPTVDGGDLGPLFADRSLRLFFCYSCYVFCSWDQFGLVCFTSLPPCEVCLCFSF